MFVFQGLRFSKPPVTIPLNVFDNLVNPPQDLLILGLPVKVFLPGGGLENDLFTHAPWPPILPRFLPQAPDPPPDLPWI
jgi:hypothetical protein